jgi:hypothetical protein
MVTAALDHLIVAAATLEQGEDYIEAKLGVRPLRGGKHATMGTHNSLLALGPRTYLEVIAIDPDGSAPTRPRWFELDRPAMQATLRASPRLLHWAARTNDIEAARSAAAIDPGPSHAHSRGEFRWRITIPDDGHLPGAGILPTLIEWSSEQHPADALPDSRLRIATLAAAHPEPGQMREALASLGLSDTLQVTYNATPRLAALVRTPRGTVAL